MQYLLHKLKYIYVLLIKKSDQVHLFDSKERHENRRAVASRQWTDVIFVGVSAQQRRRNDSANHHHNVGAAAQTEHADDGWCFWWWSAAWCCAHVVGGKCFC